MPGNLIPIKKNEKKFDFKKREEEIVRSLFEVEKFLCCCNKAKKIGCFARFIKN